MAESAALLADEVLPEQPIRQWVLSFPFQLRFLFASRPHLMGRVLGIVYRAISSHLIKKAGFTRKTVQTGAVTLIQRFGSALNLNVHFHMLFLDGVYTETKYGKTRFQRTNAPDQQELADLVHTISQRVAGILEREGILERDEESSYLNLENAEEDPMQQVIGCSVSYRIAVRPQQGRKVFTLQTIPAWEEDDRFAQVGKNPASVCMPGSRHRRGKGQSSNAFVAISPGQRYQRNACHRLGHLAGCGVHVVHCDVDAPGGMHPFGIGRRQGHHASDLNQRIGYLSIMFGSLPAEYLGVKGFGLLHIGEAEGAIGLVIGPCLQSPSIF
jgi:hypothetical protein